MYPKLSDWINDWFGTDIVLPIQSYGFFLALAFLLGAYFLYRELDRNEKEGLIEPLKKKVLRGRPTTLTELIIVFVFSLLAGFKVVGAALNYGNFANNPQDYILSFEGSWPGGVLLAAAYTAWFYFYKRKKELKPPVWEELTIHAREQTWPIVFVAVVFGVLGAKVFHWFENWEDFTADPMSSLLSFSGMSFYGGLLVAAVAVGYYAYKQGIKPWIMADSIAPSLMLSYGIGRMGCHLAGDGDWGIVNSLDKPGWLSFLPDWAWSYTYPHNIINHGIPIPGCNGPHCFQLARGVFPTSVYETTMAILFFLFLWGIRKHLRVHGMLTSIYLMLNGAERFFIEKIRVNNQFDFPGMKVTQAEVISVFLFLSGLTIFVILLQKRKKTVRPQE